MEYRFDQVAIRIEPHGGVPFRKRLAPSKTLPSIVPLEEYTKNGKRLYYAPWNSNAMREYQREIIEGHLIAIDIYSDGATLSKSGSQSANSLRVRDHS